MRELLHRCCLFDPEHAGHSQLMYGILSVASASDICLCIVSHLYNYLPQHVDDANEHRAAGNIRRGRSVGHAFLRAETPHARMPKDSHRMINQANSTLDGFPLAYGMSQRCLDLARRYGSSISWCKVQSLSMHHHDQRTFFLDSGRFDGGY